MGKSTTAINLGAALAAVGERVLLIDTDPQANATSGLGFNRGTYGHTIYEVLTGDLPLEEAIEATRVKDFFLVPSSIDLAGAEIELVARFARERQLAKALGGHDEPFRYGHRGLPALSRAHHGQRARPPPTKSSFPSNASTTPWRA